MGEGVDHGDAPACVIDLFVLQLPGMRMRDENRAQARFERRIDVRAWTVADHESALRIEFGLRDEQAVGAGILFHRDADAREMGPQSRTVELAQLLARIALGEEQEPMAADKFAERRRDTRQQFAMAVDEPIADTRDRVAQIIVMMSRGDL